MVRLEERLISLIPQNNEYIFGFADLTNLLNNKFENYKYAFVVGKRLDTKIIKLLQNGPTIEYFNLYHSTNQNLSELLDRISIELNSLNITHITIKPTVRDDELDENYNKTLRFEFSHKMAATRAGLGWIGKTGLLITKNFGPRVRLASILIDQPLEISSIPINESRCGKCRVCVDSCPAGASNGKLWNIHVDRDEFLDVFKCRDKCRELSQEKIQKDISICGICISVCPIGNSNPI